MASNPACRGTVNEWVARFSKWILSPTPKAMLNCKIYFDMRFIDGAGDLYSALSQGLANISKNELFYAAMATDINTNSVPIGIFQQFKLETDKSKHKYLDLKKRGVAIINDVVRLYSLKAGVARANTLERLEALAKHQLLAKEDVENLKDCWRFLTQLRLKTQINREGLPGKKGAPGRPGAQGKRGPPGCFITFDKDELASELTIKAQKNTNWIL